MDFKTALDIDNLTVRFGPRPVIQGFSLTLAPGEKATLTGPSGSGKSTILRCVLGFVVPERGVISIDGERLTVATVWPLRRKLAYVAQEPDLGEGRVQDILERPFSYRANTALRANLDQAPALFERFLLPAALTRDDIATLSGGEKQRVAIVSALLLERAIFLLDEAASALDAASKQAVADFFRAREDLTVLSVAHDTQGFALSKKIIELPGIETP